MNGRKQVTLQFLHSKLGILVEEPLSIDRILAFFGMHFVIRDGLDEDVTATLHVTRDGSRFAGVDFGAGESIYIRKSASEFFTIPGRRVTADGTEYILCPKTATRIALDPASRSITVATESTASEQDEIVLIELIRDVVLKNEENHGVVVLHATCAYKDGEACLIVGPKGAGKSTMLLELVSRFGYRFMSGDKTFLWVQDGRLLASGWPDYPHLGLGTLSKYPQFVERFKLAERIESAGESLWSTEHKIALDPAFFQSVLPFTEPGLVSPVGRILYPNLFPADECHVTRLSDHTPLMTPHIERIFAPGQSTWNRFIPQKNPGGLEAMTAACVQAANRLRAFEVRGSGVLAAGQGGEVA